MDIIDMGGTTSDLRDELADTVEEITTLRAQR
jgi:hypothetical protein